MQTIATAPLNVNATPEKACDWIDQKVKGHELNPNTGRMWAGAIRALLSLLRDDEPHTLNYFKESVDELSRRWCIANPSAGGDTGNKYASRARTGISLYERWLENPSGFRFESRPTGEPRKRPASETKATAQAAPSPPSTPPANDPPRPQMTSIPIPGKAPFRFEEHKDLTRADVMRIMWGLMVHCADFDPMSASPPMPPTGAGIVPAA